MKYLILEQCYIQYEKYEHEMHESVNKPSFLAIAVWFDEKYETKGIIICSHVYSWDFIE